MTGVQSLLKKSIHLIITTKKTIKGNDTLVPFKVHLLGVSHTLFQCSFHFSKQSEKFILGSPSACVTFSLISSMVFQWYF